MKKEDLFYNVLKQLNLPGDYFNVYGKTFAKFYANVKTIDGTDQKIISKKALNFFKKIQDTPLKLSVKPTGKKTKNIEFINDKYVKTTWQIYEYKISI